MFPSLCATVSGSLAECVRSTFGPFGRDKMLVSATNRVLITNSGLAILQSLITSHPVSRMLIASVVAHSNRYGDGSTALTLMIHAAFTQIAAACDSDGQSEAIGTAAAAAAPLPSGSSGGSADGSSIAGMQRASASLTDAMRRRYRRHCVGLYRALQSIQRVWLTPPSAAAASANDTKTPAAGSGGDVSLLAERLRLTGFAVSMTEPVRFKAAVVALLRTTFRTCAKRDGVLCSRLILAACTDGKFAPPAVDILTQLLTQLIFASQPLPSSTAASASAGQVSSELLPLHRVLDELAVEESIVLCYPAALHASLVLPGILMSGVSVASRSMKTDIGPAASASASNKTNVGGVRLWLLDCQFDSASTGGLDPSTTAFEADSAASYERFLRSGQNRVSSILSAARAAGINLIVSRLRLADSTLQACAAHGIIVIHGIRSELMARIQTFSGAQVITSFAPGIDHALSRTGEASEFHQLVVGGKPMCQLIPLPPPASVPAAATAAAGAKIPPAATARHRVIAHTIVLGAGSEGLCRQYEQALIRAAQMLSQSSRDEPLRGSASPTLWVCGGGCAVELELYFLFRDLSERIATGRVSAADEIVSRALSAHGFSANQTAPVASAHYLSWAYRVLAAAWFELPAALFRNSQSRTAAGGRVRAAFLRVCADLKTARGSGADGISRVGFVAIDASSLVSELMADATRFDASGESDTESERDNKSPLPDTAGLLKLRPSPAANSPAASFGAIDSLSSKHALTEQLMAAVCTLLRVDDVLRVRKISSPHASQFVRTNHATAAAAAATSDGDDDAGGDSDADSA